MIQNRFAGYAFLAEKYHLNVIPNREIHQLACLQQPNRETFAKKRCWLLPKTALLIPVFGIPITGEHRIISEKPYRFSSSRFTIFVRNQKILLTLWRAWSLHTERWSLQTFRLLFMRQLSLMGLSSCTLLKMATAACTAFLSIIFSLSEAAFQSDSCFRFPQQCWKIRFCTQPLLKNIPFHCCNWLTIIWNYTCSSRSYPRQIAPLAHVKSNRNIPGSRRKRGSGMVCRIPRKQRGRVSHRLQHYRRWRTFITTTARRIHWMGITVPIRFFLQPALPLLWFLGCMKNAVNSDFISRVLEENSIRKPPH